MPVRVRRGCTDGPCRVHGGLCALSGYAMPFFLLFLLLHLRFFLFFLSSFYFSSTFSFSLFLFPPPFVSPLLHFLLSIPVSCPPALSCTLLSPLFSSPHLREGLLETGRCTGPEIPIPTPSPPWVSIFKGSHLFSSFCLLFLRFLHRPASPACPYSSASILSLLQYPFYPYHRNLAHTDSFLSSTGWSTNWLHVLPLHPIPLSLLLLFFLFVIFSSLIPGASSIVYFSCHLSHFSAASSASFLPSIKRRASAAPTRLLQLKSRFVL